MNMVVIDAHAVAYKAHFSAMQGRASLSAKGLTHVDGTPVGVIYTFLSLIKVIAEQTQCVNFVFTWDSIESKRRKIYPEYKQQRRDKREKEKDPELEEAFWQFDQLYEVILPRLGFVNNFKYAGYEADDIIAQCCTYQQKGWDITIVSPDHDLYQLLSPNVKILSPSKWTWYTYDHFKIEWCGLEPEDFIGIKAIAGCPGDNVKGIYGIGEVKALKYLIDKSRVHHPKIDNPEAHLIIKRNWPLVRLPFKGCPIPKIKFPKMNFQNWKDFIEEYRFYTYAKNPRFWRKLYNGEPPMGYFPIPGSSRGKSKYK